VCGRYVADAEMEEVWFTAAAVTQRPHRPSTDVSLQAQPENRFETDGWTDRPSLLQATFMIENEQNIQKNTYSANAHDVEK